MSAGLHVTVVGDARNPSLSDLAAELQRTLRLADRSWTVESALSPASDAAVVAVLGPAVADNLRIGEVIGGRAASNVAIVSAPGSLRWDRRRGDFDPVDSPALPAPMLGAFDDPPALVSLPLAASGARLNVDEPAQRAAIDRLASHLTSIEMGRFAALRTVRRRRLLGLFVVAAFLLAGAAGFALGRLQTAGAAGETAAAVPGPTTSAPPPTTLAPATTEERVDTDVAGLTAELRGEVERANEALGRANDQAIEADAARVEAERNAEEATLERLAAQDARDEAVESAGVAERARITTTGERAAFESLTLADRRPDRAALLAREATLRTGSGTASHALLTALQAQPLLAGYRGLSEAPPRDVAILDEQSLVVLLDDGTLEIRGRSTGTVGVSWTSSSKAVVVIVPRPDIVVTGHVDGSIRLWNALGSLLDEHVAVHGARIQEIEASADGTVLVSLAHDVDPANGLRDSATISWDLTDDELRERVRVGGVCGQASTIAISAVGGLVFVPASRCDGTAGFIEVYNTATGALFDRLPVPVLQAPNQISALTTVDQFLFYGTNAGEVYELDLLGPAPTAESSLLIGLHDGLVAEIVYEPTVDVVATVGFDGVLELIGVTTRAELTGHDSSVLDVAVGGGRLYTASEDGNVAEWNLVEPRTLQSVTAPVAAALTAPATSPHGDWYVVGDRSGTLSRQSTTTTEIASVDVGIGLTAVALDPAGETVAAGSIDGSVVFLDSSLTGSSDLHERVHDGPAPFLGQTHVTDIEFGPSGLLAISTADDGTVLRWSRTPDGWSHSVVLREDAAVFDAAFSPDGEFLALALWQEEVRVLDAGSFELVASLRPVARPMFGVAFDPTGTSLAMTGLSGTVYRYDAVTWERNGEPLSPPGASQADLFLYSIAYTNDGTMLVGTSIFGLFLWDVESGTSLGSPFAQPSSAPDESAEPLSGRIGSSGAAMTDSVAVFTRSGLVAEIVPIDINVWRDEACKLANRTLTSAEWASAFPDDPFDPSCSLDP